MIQWFTSFRAKLILTIFPLVAAVTAVSLWIAERRFSVAQQTLIEEQFRAHIDAFNDTRESRSESLAKALMTKASSPELIAACRDGKAQAALTLLEPLKQIVRDRLQSEPGTMNRGKQLSGRPARGPERKGGDARQPFGQEPYFRIFNAAGELMPRPPQAIRGPKGETRSDTSAIDGDELRRRSGKLPWPEGKELKEVLMTQQTAYLLLETPQGRDQVREIIVTPVRDLETNAFYGGIVLGLPMPTLAERLLFQQSKRMDLGEIMTGNWVEGKLVSSTIPEAQREEIATVLKHELEHGSKTHRVITTSIDGIRYRLIYEVLNPGSPFPVAAQVNLYSLAGVDAEVAELRKMAIEIAIVAMVVSLGLILFVSRGLSGPITDLVRGTQEIERGNFDFRVPVKSKDEIGRLASSFNDMAAGLALQERYRSVLNAVADPTVAQELIASRTALGGELREVSMLFCDIRGFTSLTEGMPPDQVIELLNDHMTALTDVAYRHGGIVDKFVGDLIMVLFGAPLSADEDALRAVQCASAMLEARHRLNETSILPIEVGIGIATGTVVAGCMGSSQRLSYTVLGERVNLASRLCSIAQAGEIVIDAHTKELVGEQIEAAPLQPIQLKGFSGPVQCFKVTRVSTVMEAG